MARILVTALSAVTMLFVGIASLSYRAETIDSTNLNNTSQEALNLTHEVTGDVTAIAGGALPRVFIVVLLALLVGLLIIARP